MSWKTRFQWYRLKTILQSFVALYYLSPRDVDAFLDAYCIFDHEWADEDELKRRMGENYYQEVKKRIVDYYRVLNLLCALGPLEKMYVPPVTDLSRSIIANQNLFEQKMSRDLGIKKGDTVLDIGCGKGRVASHIASITGADVVGVNIDLRQLESARRFACYHGLKHQCQFQVADLNDTPLPFAADRFDAIYEIQALSYARDLDKLCGDLHRILKPGGKVACLDWVQLPAYDATNPRHVDLINRIKPLIGAIGTPTAAAYVDCMRKANFKILVSENASINGLQAPLFENAERFFRYLARLIQFTVRLRVLPGHFEVLFDRLRKGGEALIEADRERLVTTSYYLVAQKEMANC